MEIQMTARVTGPFGEFDRRQRLNSENYPVEYLRHLVEIDAAYATVDHKMENPIETKEVVEEKKPFTASQPAPASRKRTAKSSGKKPAL